MSFKIEGINIGAGHSPFVIAEMSGNHNQSLQRALDIVDAIAESGAQALKLQTYTPDTMTIDISEGDFFISNPNSPWEGSSLYDLYKKAHTPWEWHKPIFERAKKHGLIAFSSPFDSSAVDFLESLNVPAYKVASFEIVDLPLIRKIASTGKPMIISTGMASIAEIDDAVRTARESGCKNIALLKCTSSYPASPSSSNLVTIPYLHNLFKCEVGLSDHTLGIGAAVASVALGASIIEKHVTLSRSEGGVDSDFSLEPDELKQLVVETKTAWEALGEVGFGPSKDEKNSLVFRRSLYICEAMDKDECLTEKKLKAIRPGYGLSPKYLDKILGKKVVKSVAKGTPMSWELLE